MSKIKNYLDEILNREDTLENTENTDNMSCLELLGYLNKLIGEEND